MNDSGSWWHNLEVVEGGLTPSKKLIALAVSRILELNVLLESLGRTGNVDNDGVVDDHFSGSKRIYLLRIATEVGHCLAHGG